MIRESRKARRVTLRIFPDRRIEVVVPNGFDKRLVPGIVSEKEGWIQRVFKKMGRSGEDSAQSTPAPALPEYVHLKAIDRLYRVEYFTMMTGRLDLREHGESRLILSGDVGGYEACRHLLQRWLRRKAALHLVAALRQASFETGLSFAKVQIRSQASRWGSCSSRGTISLNCKLMFLPHKLVRYILLHELCHTVHLDHSHRFWSLLSKHESNCGSLRAEVRASDALVPHWAR
jgi:predicted metal-dependent hydrolase